MQVSLSIEEAKALKDKGFVTNEFLTFIFPVNVCIKDFGMSSEDYKDAMCNLFRQDLISIGPRSQQISPIDIQALRNLSNH